MDMAYSVAGLVGIDVPVIVQSEDSDVALPAALASGASDTGPVVASSALVVEKLAGHTAVQSADLHAAALVDP